MSMWLQKLSSFHKKSIIGILAHVYMRTAKSIADTLVVVFDEIINAADTRFFYKKNVYKKMSLKNPKTLKKKLKKI